MATVNDVIFTKDNRYIVSVASDKTIRIWDTVEKELARTIRLEIGPGNNGKIFALALSPDNKVLAVGGFLAPKPASILLLDFESGEVISQLNGHNNTINDLAFSPDGLKLVSASADKTAIIWDLISGTPQHILRGHQEYINTAAFSPQGTKVVTGSSDQTLKLWDVEFGNAIATMKGHQGKIQAVVFTPNDEIISGDSGGNILRWNPQGELVKKLASQETAVSSLSISPDGKKILTGHGCCDGTKPSYVINTDSGEKLITFSQHLNSVRATAISPNGRFAATAGGNDNEILFWDINNGTILNTFVGRGRAIWSISFSKDGNSIAWGTQWARDNVFSYGNLEQEFFLFNEEGDLNPRPGGKVDLSNNQKFCQPVKSVGDISVHTKDSNVDSILSIARNNNITQSIIRDHSSGLDHRSVTMAPDGKTVISGGAWGEITSYNTETGAIVNDFIGHTATVWALAVSPDNRYLISGSTDQTIKLWNLHTGKNLLTIFCDDSNQWVTWTPEGYYDASVKGSDYIGWHINQGLEKNALFYPASKFSKQFFLPELVASYVKAQGDIASSFELINTDKSPHKKLTATDSQSLLTIFPPLVRFTSHSDTEITATGNSIIITAEAISQNNEPITDIWFTLNGKRVNKTRSIGMKEKKLESPNFTLGQDKKVSLTAEIFLAENFNKIGLVAANRYSQSEPLIINVESAPQVKITAGEPNIYKPDLYLLAIGISEYQNNNFNLDVAHKDALGVSAAIGAKATQLFSKVNKRVIVNTDATRDNILAGLDWIQRESTQKDVSIIFIAGHGVRDTTNNFYFLPHDGDPEKLRQTSIKWDDFQDVLTNLPSKVIFFVDTCHSGSITGKRRGLNFSPAADITNALREIINTETGIIVMTSSSGNEVSQEKPEWGHGAFSKALIEGIEGMANYDNNRTVDIKELDLYMTKRVKELTAGSQHPTTEIPKTLPNFPLFVVD
ncbi:MAG: caspase family protein [Proteobacteria bacterium]|nr:caspase family protein [Pseudomonadota bacterium]MBU1714875.1 caspase family protein [Pseudomonadota bacterium]